MPNEDALRSSVRAAVSTFGELVADKLKGPGDPEEQLRTPTELLIRSVAESFGLKAVLHGEVRLIDLRARPDYRLDIAGAPVGYIEIKKDETQIRPELFRGHNAKQWEKLRLLPNVLYTNGRDWTVYRNGQQVGESGRLTAPVRTSGSKLAPDGDNFIRTLQSFLFWKPETPRTIGQLINSIANLCKLLRSEVVEAMRLEATNQNRPMFTLLAQDWRDLLFPEASNETFADHYAQTVTFALLLARVEGITFDGQDLSVIAKQLGKKHSIMGKALAVLTDDPERGLGATLDTLLSVIGAVDWDLLDDGSGSAYLRLYTDFLAVYDPELREATGSYFTPDAIVDFMARTTNELLREHLHRDRGFASRDVVVVDPAMGTGTFLLNIVERVAEIIGATEGPGAIPPRLREAVSERLVGFEKQTGPFAIAEMRLHGALRQHRAEAPSQGLRIYMADTLDDPYLRQTHLGHTYEPLASSRRAANKLKRDEAVMVVIGNPPYDAVTHGDGKWVENGESSRSRPAPLDSFRQPGNGRYEYVLTNLHVYFWRWATWKVFDRHKDTPQGIVAFISPSAYIQSRGFAGMRRYLRQTVDEGWIVDLSPEGHQPDVATRVFKGVRQPICIGIFARYGGPRPEQPATIHYIATHGARQGKFDQLSSLRIGEGHWQPTSTGWTDTFLPAQDSRWVDYPLLGDILPWSCRGVTTGRTWVYAPDKETLADRWNVFLGASIVERRRLLVESRDRKIDSRVEGLARIEPRRLRLQDETKASPEPIRVGYRSFDRQWLIPDSRLMAVPRPDLWRARSDAQIYAYELHTKSPTSGPPITFSKLIPDLHFYRGNNGGRAMPLYRDEAAQLPNMQPDLLAFLTSRVGCRIKASDLLAYIAGVASHAGYTETFMEQLRTPGVRVPLTSDADIWKRAVKIGQRVLWLHTYGEAYASPRDGRPPNPPMLPRGRRPKVVVEIPDTTKDMPETIGYDLDTQTLLVGSGSISAVTPEIWAYEVSGMHVVKKWFGYRKKSPAGKKTSPLDYINAERWHPERTRELLELLNVLGLIIDLEPTQRNLLTTVCDGPLIGVSDLQAAHLWPVEAHWRQPLGSAGTTLFDPLPD